MLGDVPGATPELSVALQPRLTSPVWHAPNSPVAEVALRAEIYDLTRASRVKSAELQRMAQAHAEAQRTVAKAEAEVQRRSNEEPYASRAIGLAQQQTALRAGYLGERAQEAYALCQRECLAA